MTSNNPRINTMLELLQLNTTFFKASFVGVNNQQALVRPNETSNNMAWLGMHCVGARYYMAELAGKKVTYPLAAYDQEVNVRSVNDMKHAPSNELILEAWQQGHNYLVSTWLDLKDEQLNAATNQHFLMSQDSLFHMTLFFLHHEASHIGQLQLLRRYLGLAPMKYS